MFQRRATAFQLWYPLALQWVTLGIEFHRSGSAGASRETCELASLSGGWEQLKADADAPTLVLLAPSVSPASRHFASKAAAPLMFSGSAGAPSATAALPQPAGTPLLPAS